ncbi:hypothetical protein [Streptomyces sp. KL116D]|uniref:hypothetical protein n=1 Tax=Streptomyces sp. KL116D TaxID=3045152 RepID=UPI0035588DA6
MRNSLTDEEYAEQAAKGEPEKGRWSQLEQLVAGLDDRIASLQHITICANTDSKSKRPKAPEPIRRPGVRAVKTKQKISPQQAEHLWSMLNGGAA